MSITKSKLTNVVYKQMKLERKKTTEIVDIFFQEMKSGMIENGFVNIYGLGKFSIIEKKARKCRNPKTGESMTISPRKIISFHHSAVLKEWLNR